MSIATYKVAILKGTAEAVAELAKGIITEANNGGVSEETAKEALEVVTDFRRSLRTIANGGVAPTRETKAKASTRKA